MRRLILAALVAVAVLDPARALEPAEVYQDPKAAAFYAANPEFFRFARPEDLPKDLVWQDGASEEEFADPRAVRGGTHRLVLRGGPPVLRRVGPNSNNSFRGYAYDANDFNLIAAHPNTLKPIPALATHWALSEDGQTAWFKLDPNARFTDGQPIRADDYLFSFYFYRSPWIQAPWYADFYTREFGGITKYDDLTIAVHAPRKRPEPLFWLGGLGPTPRQFFKDFGPDYITAYAQRFQPTAGAYDLRPENFRRDQEITFTRVTPWWGDSRRFYRHRYNPDAQSFRIVREVDKSFQMFLQGEFDLMPVGTPRYWYGLNEQPAYQLGYLSKVQFYNDVPRPPYGIYINSLRAPLDQLEVRIGLQHSLDFERVIATFYRGDYGRLSQFSEGFGVYTNPKIKPRMFSPKLAREAFARAGFDQVDHDGILKDKLGRRLSVMLTMDDSDRRKFLATLVESAHRCGVELRTESLEHTTMYRKVMEKRHDLVFWAWGATGMWPELWQSHHSVNAVERTADGRLIPKRQTNNLTGTNLPELDRLIDQFRASSDAEEMRQLTHRAQEIIHDDAAFIPGFRIPGYRVAHWPWLRFPESFDVRSSDEPFVAGLYWLDPARREQDLANFRAGKKLGPPVNRVLDRWRTD